jgi:hypothetical protein
MRDVPEREISQFPRSRVKSLGNGEFEINGVAPGKYRMRLSWSEDLSSPFDTSRQTRTSISAAVEVVDKDVDLGTLSSKVGQVSLPVRFTSADGVQSDVTIVATSTNWVGGGGLLNSLAPTLRLNNLDLGEYALEFLTTGTERYVSIARYNGQDLFGGPLIVDGGDHGSLEVVVDGPSGTVEGILRDAKGDTVPGAQVVLVPPQFHRANSYHFRTAKTDQTGAFRFVGVPPGEYSAFSWASSERLAYRDPEWLREYETRGAAVSVRKGQTSMVNVRVIERR